MAVIYCITNTVNGKVYVGKTVQEPHVRWRSHVKLAEEGKNIYFSHAIRKYGPGAFVLSTLEVVDNVDDLDDAERKWIKELRSSDRKFGYNSTHGGEGFSYGDLNPNRLNPRKGADSPSYGRAVAPETRQKISETLTGLLVGEKNPFFGRTHTEETKEKIGARTRGVKLGPHSEETCEKIRQRMLGREFSPETLEKMRQAKLGRQLSPEHRAKLSEAQKNRRQREASPQ